MMCMWVCGCARIETRYDYKLCVCVFLYQNSNIKLQNIRTPLYLRKAYIEKLQNLKDNVMFRVGKSITTSAAVWWSQPWWTVLTLSFDMRPGQLWWAVPDERSFAAFVHKRCWEWQELQLQCCTAVSPVRMCCWTRWVPSLFLRFIMVHQLWRTMLARFISCRCGKKTYRPYKLGGGNSNIFWCSPLLGGDPHVWLIFFRWVETTT